MVSFREDSQINDAYSQMQCGGLDSSESSFDELTVIILQESMGWTETKPRTRNQQPGANGGEVGREFYGSESKTSAVQAHLEIQEARSAG